MLAGTNVGRQLNFINGINGVAAGGNAIANLDVNKRYHRIKLQCAAVNYTGGTGLAAVKVTSTSGAGGIGTLAVSNGIPGLVSAVSGGTGWVTGDIATLTDATGAGAQFTVTASSGALTALVYIASTAIASPIDPGTLIVAMQLLVNGINMRDITPRLEMMIAQANGHNSRLGELPVFFSEPWRDIVAASDANSWDMAGQSTFQLKFQIASGYLLPSVTGTQEFDFGRNVRPVAAGAKPTYFLDPFSHHAYTIPIVAGINSINTIPFDWPIGRVWLIGSIAGQITQLEVYQDSNKIMEATTEQLKESYSDYGFQFGQQTFAESTQTAQKTLGLNPLNYFDAAFISDPDQRYWKALKCGNSYVLRVYSAQAQQLTIVQETLPGSYSA